MTGSGGFIGKNLKEYLSEKYNLFTPRSYELDLCDCNAVNRYFAENEIDFIIHCGSTGGARGIQDRDTTIEDNLAMVDNLLNAKREDVRMILFGSGAMYDKSRPLCKVLESEIGKVVPQDLYGKSKMLIAQKIKDRKDVLCLNIFACYGYGEKENRFPSYAINCALRGLPIEINQNVVFDYLWVEDMAKIVEHFLRNVVQDNILNITPTQQVSLFEIAQAVNSIAEKPVPIVVKNPIMNNEYTGSNALLLKNFPKMTFTELNEGIEKLYRYIETSLELVK